MSKSAAAKQPKTVADRRASLRAANQPASGPGVKKTRKTAEIDLTKPKARELLASLFPLPENETFLQATPELEQAALEYVAARDEEKAANERKTIAGNILCNAIGKNLGVIGKGWKATWGKKAGNVDWNALASELGISPKKIEKHRRPDGRSFDLSETAGPAAET